MPHYLLQASYTAQGVSGLVSSPEDRSGAIRSLVESNGGRMETLYYAFGDSDVIAIIELPDNVTMAALSMAVGASGGVTNIRTTVLMPISEGVEAARKAAGINYRPPGS
ncbi:MAG: hypothetical protein BZY87_04050 [SAR202 cluster bacterium Io17-Chloro-G6]|nr:MAG: hypothetical protein BZY87_04050 [SAR202 cluster bacterium Io17-Chloro-G6]